MPKYHTGFQTWRLTRNEERQMLQFFTGQQDWRDEDVGADWVIRANEVLLNGYEIGRGPVPNAPRDPLGRARGEWVEQDFPMTVRTIFLAAGFREAVPLAPGVEQGWRDVVINELAPPGQGPAPAAGDWRNVQPAELAAGMIRPIPARRPARLDWGADMPKKKNISLNNHKASTTVLSVFGMFPSNGTPRKMREGMLLSLAPEKFPYDHCVGLEIEVEGVRNSANRELHKLIAEGFDSKADGSLRNGIEYVTKLGLTAGDACGYIAALDQEFALGRGTDRARNHFSFRCGLHVHVDVTGHTMEELYRACLIYTVVEPLLFEISGKRNQNKFCVGVQDCVSAVEQLIHYGRERNWNKFVGALMAGSKYMAMNIRTVPNFGTVEFRHHEGTVDPIQVRKWLTVLCDIVVGAKKASTETLEKDVEQLNTVSSYGKFLADYLPNGGHHLKAIPNFQKLMYPGSTFVKQTFLTEPTGQAAGHLEQ